MLMMMSTAGATIRKSARPQRPQKIPARMWLVRGLDTTTHREDATGDSPDDEPAREVGQEADCKQQQAQFRQGMHAHLREVAKRTVERGCDPRGDRAAVAEDVARHAIDVADDQQDG